MLGFDLTEEQLELQATARRFARAEILPVAARHDETEEFPLEICKRAFEAGLMNLQVPAEHGGLGLGVLDTCIVEEELNYACAGITNALAANGLATSPLLIAGTTEQKREYLGRLMSEPSFAAFALTEPGSGSDAASISTTYRRVGDDFVINGHKHFISNGSMASWYVVFATRDRSLRHSGISAFLVRRDAPGLEARRMHGKLGQRAADTAEVTFEDVVVRKAGLLGAEGEGFKVAMRTFDRSRPEITAIAVGVSQRALDESVRYAKERHQFGQPIASFQAIQFILAEMALQIEAMRLLTHKAAWLIDAGQGAPMVSAYAKAFGADAAMRITTDAVQVFGGYGYMREYPVEKLMRDAKLLQIYEGTSQVQRVVIARHLLR